MYMHTQTLIAHIHAEFTVGEWCWAGRECGAAPAIFAYPSLALNLLNTGLPSPLLTL